MAAFFKPYFLYGFMGFYNSVEIWVVSSVSRCDADLPVFERVIFVHKFFGEFLSCILRLRPACEGTQIFGAY